MPRLSISSSGLGPFVPDLGRASFCQGAPPSRGGEWLSPFGRIRCKNGTVQFRNAKAVLANRGPGFGNGAVALGIGKMPCANRRLGSAIGHAWCQIGKAGQERTTAG